MPRGEDAAVAAGRQAEAAIVAAAEPVQPKACKRTRQPTQEGGESGRPSKRSRWEPSPARPTIPFAVALAAARAAAAIGRASQPPPAQPSPLPAPTATTPAVRPSWPPTPTRPMCEEERAYYTYYANNLDSLAPKYQAAAPVPPPAVEHGQREREEGAGDGQRGEAAATGGLACPGAQARSPRA